MNNIKQVIIIRTDLNMRKGKMIAQGAHASMKVFFDRMNIISEKDIPYSERMYECVYMYDCHNKINHFDCDNCQEFKLSGKNCNSSFTPQMTQWMEDSFTKIVVGCNSEEELHRLQKQAEKAGIVNAIILDNGNTEFKEICSFCNGTGNENKDNGTDNFCYCFKCGEGWQNK